MRDQTIVSRGYVQRPRNPQTTAGVERAQHDRSDIGFMETTPPQLGARCSITTPGAMQNQFQFHSAGEASHYHDDPATGAQMPSKNHSLAGLSSASRWRIASRIQSLFESPYSNWLSISSTSSSSTRNDTGVSGFDSGMVVHTPLYYINHWAKKVANRYRSTVQQYLSSWVNNGRMSHE